MYITYQRDGRNTLINTDKVSSFWVAPNSLNGEYVPSVCYTIDGKDELFVRCSTVDECNSIISKIGNVISGNDPYPTTAFTENVQLSTITMMPYKEFPFDVVYLKNDPTYLLGHMEICGDKTGYYLALNNAARTGSRRLSCVYSSREIVESKLDLLRKAIKEGAKSFRFQDWY